MDEKIVNGSNKEIVKNYFEDITQLGLEFMTRDKFRSDMKSIKTSELVHDTPYMGKTIEELLEIVESDILPHCSNFSNTGFLGFPDSGNSIAGLLGGSLTVFLQQNLINSSFCSPIGTHIEISVINWLRELLGYSVNKDIKDIFDVGGIVTGGGTMSNSIAMLLAREHHKKETLINGVSSPESFKVIVPEGIGHYSIKSSLMWLGCGDNVIEAPTESYRYDLKKLESILIENKGQIMSVVAYAGDSRTMTVENLKGLYKLVRSMDDNIWLHVDACHGFSLAFSQEQKSKIEGINLYDSISIDPHKVMMVPYTVSGLLLKNPEKFRLIHTSSDLIMEEPFAFGQITPFVGSKEWMSLKLWFVMQNIGFEGLGQIVEKRCALAKYFSKKLSETNNFIVMNEVDYNSVVFVYIADKNADLDLEIVNDNNRKLKQLIDLEGRYYLHQFSIRDYCNTISDKKVIYPLRYMSGNDNLSYDDIDDLVDYLERIVETKLEVQND